jgi:hypothetical protein
MSWHQWQTGYAGEWQNKDWQGEDGDWHYHGDWQKKHREDHSASSQKDHRGLDDWKGHDGWKDQDVWQGQNSCAGKVEGPAGQEQTWHGTSTCFQVNASPSGTGEASSGEGPSQLDHHVPKYTSDPHEGYASFEVLPEPPSSWLGHSPPLMTPPMPPSDEHLRRAQTCSAMGRHTMCFNAWLTSLQEAEFASVVGKNSDQLERWITRLASQNIPVAMSGKDYTSDGLTRHLEEHVATGSWRLFAVVGGGAYTSHSIACARCTALLTKESPYLGKQDKRVEEQWEMRVELNSVLSAFLGLEVKKHLCPVETAMPGAVIPKPGAPWNGGW